MSYSENLRHRKLMLLKSDEFVQTSAGFLIIENIFIVSEQNPRVGIARVFVRAYIWLPTEVSYNGTNRQDLYFPNIRLQDVKFGAAPVLFRIFNPFFLFATFTLSAICKVIRLLVVTHLLNNIFISGQVLFY